MKIGLPFLTQVQGTPEDDALVDGGDPARSLGGWTAQTIRQLVSQISTAYHIQHNDDDTHKTITATGSVTERDRATAMGDWIQMAFSAANFTGNNSMTWTVAVANQITARYMLVGTTLFFQFKLVSTTVGGALDTALRLTLPVAYAAPYPQFGTYHFVDNGTHGIGLWGISASADQPIVLELSKMDYTTSFAASASATDVRLSGFIEVSALAR